MVSGGEQRGGGTGGDGGSSFLGPGWYQGTLVRDGAEAEDARIENLTMRASDSLYIRMRSGGGFVGRFTR